MTPRAAVFLDRDGTLIVETEYLSDPADVEFVPGAIDALVRLRRAGWLLVVVTNQAGIARGYYTEADYSAVEAYIDAELAKHGVVLDGTWHCPHHPDFGGVCACRKPALGMYEEAAEALGVDLHRSVYVGDKASDVLPALAVGGRGILVLTGYGSEHAPDLPSEVRVVDDLGAAADVVLASRQR